MRIFLLGGRSTNSIVDIQLSHRFLVIRCLDKLIEIDIVEHSTLSAHSEKARN